MYGVPPPPSDQPEQLEEFIKNNTDSTGQGCVRDLVKYGFIPSFNNFFLLFYFCKFQYFDHIFLTTCPNAVILVQPQSPILSAHFIFLAWRDVTLSKLSLMPILSIFGHMMSRHVSHMSHDCHSHMVMGFPMVFPWFLLDFSIVSLSYHILILE